MGWESSGSQWSLLCFLSFISFSSCLSATSLWEIETFSRVGWFLWSFRLWFYYSLIIIKRGNANKIISRSRFWSKASNLTRIWMKSLPHPHVIRLRSHSSMLDRHLSLYRKLGIKNSRKKRRKTALFSCKQNKMKTKKKLNRLNNLFLFKSKNLRAYWISRSLETSCFSNNKGRL